MVGEESMRVVGRWLGTMAAVAAIGLGAAGCGGDSAGSAGALTSFGHMAGYVWVGHVGAVAASWSVPRMSGSGEAHASTWIGAQAPGLPRHSPFIQVGTLEDRGSDSTPAYAAFWTDTIRGFHPRILFRVRPGDAVSTALRLRAGRWRVYIVDNTSGQGSSFSTSEEGADDFNLAEWLQENPSETSGETTRYPKLSTVGMHALTVNGAGPSYRDMFAQWMSLPARDLAPTPLSDDAFTITSGVVTAAAARYLKIAHAQNVNARRLDVEAARFTAHSPPREIQRVSGEGAAMQRSYVDGLEHAAWPAAARGPISSLVREVRVQIGMFAAAAQQAPASLAAWRGEFVALQPPLLKLAHQVRRALRLPEPLTGQVAASERRKPG
jgi:hypothetical protein